MENTKAKNTKWKDLERLGFLVRFMNQLGLSTTDVANALGQSRQSVCRWFTNDDCMISKVHAIAEHYGYELQMSFDQDYEKKGKSWVKIEQIINYGNIIGEEFVPHRLTPLNIALARSGISKTQLASDLGLTWQNVSRWFKESVDDTSMKHIYEIAELYNWQISFAFMKKTNSTDFQLDEAKS